jgi:hypothetical protein
VANFLGVRSETVSKTITRTAFPIPTIVIEGPELVYLRSTTSLGISAHATLPPCFDASTLSIVFQWNNTAIGRLPGTPLTASTSGFLTLDAATQSSRSLSLVGASLLAGLRYTLHITGCMAAAPVNCGHAEVDVALTPEPLVAIIEGGQTRNVGADSSLELDACPSADADDPQAVCTVSANGQTSCGVLRFEWSCRPLSAGLLCVQPPVGQQISCKWSIPPGSFSPGNYTIGLNVTKASGLADIATTSVHISVVAGNPPSVFITTPSASSGSFKPNINSRLRLAANMAGGSSVGIAFAWSISSSDTSAFVDLSSTTVTSTGIALPDLVILPHALRTGATYNVQVELAACDALSPWGPSSPSYLRCQHAHAHETCT